MLIMFYTVKYVSSGLHTEDSSVKNTICTPHDFTPIIHFGPMCASMEMEETGCVD